MSRQIISILVIFLVILPFTLTQEEENEEEIEDVNKNELPIVRCDKKTKIKSLCGIKEESAIRIYDDTYKAQIEYIRDYCEKDEVCAANDESEIYMKCRPQFPKSLRNQGKKCVFDTDCKSKICRGGKCQTVGNGAVCNNDFSCEPGYYCNKEGLEWTCQPLILEDGYCQENHNLVCTPGTACMKEVDGYSWKCKKIGSIDEGEQTTNAIFCKTGLEYDGTCVYVIRNDDCTKEGENYYCQPNLSGISEEKKIKCKSLDGIHVCPYTIEKSELFSQYYESFDKIDKADFAKKEKHRVTLSNTYYLDKTKTFIKYISYRYYEELVIQGIMNSKGKVKKKCEFQHILRYLDSHFNKVGKVLLGFLIVMLL